MRVLRQPSAFLPLVMSLVVVIFMVKYIAEFGLVRQSDEGTAAHLFQILMPAQLPLIAYFAYNWLPRAPRQAVVVLALQVGIALAIFAVVFLFLG
ncbi:MAG: hypothetical protein ABJB39_04875 [Chloroflexota bacterium]